MTSGKQIDHEMQPKERTTHGWWRRLGILCLLLAAAATASRAQTFTSLHSFDLTDGAGPSAALVQGGDGNVYGTTYNGGANGTNAGTVFKITPDGTLTTIYTFSGPDGYTAQDPLVLAVGGTFYSTTRTGGTIGDGTVFSLTPSGTLTTLHSFDFSDGTEPIVGMVQASSGDLYGGTYQGGSTNYGTLFKITPTGSFTMLHTFCLQSGCLDGANPLGGLIQGTDGNLYGTTANNQGATTENAGTVFKLTPNGALTTLHSFDGTDGAAPECALVEGTDGNLYGTTYGGGAHGDGTVFKVTPGGTFTTLYSFCPESGCTDGESVFAGLIQATDGNFYGATYWGGAHNYGTIFRITPAGVLTTLHSFDNTDGANPTASLIEATDGILYGTTVFGGTSGNGTVFSLAVGLSAFVETVPAAGKVGQRVLILGTDLTGATSVTFNGTAATFTVNATGTAINTKVPSGATSGTVQVVTPGGTLSSNVIFRVRQ